MARAMAGAPWRRSPSMAHDRHEHCAEEPRYLRSRNAGGLPHTRGRAGGGNRSALPQPDRGDGPAERMARGRPAGFADHGAGTG